jgi:hypothetical protein
MYRHCLSVTPLHVQVQGLATCAFDGSLEVKQGCCSTACAEQMKQVGIAAATVDTVFSQKCCAE